MTREKLVTVPVGTTLEEAKALLHKHRIEKLLVVDDHGNLKGLITVKDIQKMIEYPNACKDSWAACGWRARWGRRAITWSAPRRWSTPRWTSWCSTPRTATATGAGDGGQSCARRFPTCR